MRNERLTAYQKFVLGGFAVAAVVVLAFVVMVHIAVVVALGAM